MTRTYRIWRRKPHPERLHFYWDFPIYYEQKKRISCICKRRKIRNRWWKTLRHYNNALCKNCYNHYTDADSVDEYFNTRYYKADYTEFFD